VKHRFIEGHRHRYDVKVLCDVLQVWSDGKGTVVRLRMDHEDP